MEAIDFPAKELMKTKSCDNIIKQIKHSISVNVKCGMFHYYVFSQSLVESPKVKELIKDIFTSEGYDVVDRDAHLLISWDKSESSSSEVELNIKNSLEALIVNIKRSILVSSNDGLFKATAISVPTNKVLYDKIYTYLTSKGYTVVLHEKEKHQISPYITITWYN